VLNYLAALEPSELGPVAELFFAPLSRALQQPADAAEAPSTDSFAEWRCAWVHRLSWRLLRVSWEGRKYPICSAHGANGTVSQTGAHLMQTGIGPLVQPSSDLWSTELRQWKSV